MRYIFLFLLIGTLHAQNLHQVNVPTAIGGSPHPSSLLTLNSIDKGFLIPRMTTSQKNAIPTPATGLMVYDTDLNQIQVFNGTWGSLGGGGSVAGSNGEIQFNNNGAFGASSNLYWDNTNNRLSLGDTSPSSTIYLRKDSLGQTFDETQGIILENKTPVTAGVQQFSPTITMIGSASKSNSLTDPVKYRLGVASQLAGGGSYYSNLRIDVDDGDGTYQTLAAFAPERLAAPLIGQNPNGHLRVQGISPNPGSVLEITGGSQSYGISSVRITSENTTTPGTILSVGKTFFGSTNVDFNSITSNPTINQSAGTAITRGFLVSPTLTNAIDWRSIEWNNNTGWGLYGAGTANNYLAGNTSIGTTQTGARLNIAGSTTTNGQDALLVEASDGTDLFEVENGGLISVGKNVGATTQSTATIQVRSGDTSTGLALVPKGEGAITASIPDAGVAGGNVRGGYSVDLQRFRNAATQVASGSYSVIAGGQYNSSPSNFAVIGGGSFNVTSTNNYTSVLGGLDNQSTGAYASIGGGQANRATELASTVSGGQTNSASGSRSTVIGGDGNTASGNRAIAGGATNVASGEFSIAIGGWNSRAVLYGQRSIASGQFAATGTVCDNQTSDIRFRALVTGTAQTQLFLDGVDDVAQLSLVGTTNARVWNARIQCVAIVTAQGNGTVAAGLTHSETYDIVIKRTSAGTVIVGSSPLGVIRVSEMTGASFTVDADTTNNALRIRFTPPSGAGSTTTIRAAATAYLTELGY
jgi:hypothetical protein